MTVRRLRRGFIGIVALSGACGNVTRDPEPVPGDGASGAAGSAVSAKGGTVGLGGNGSSGSPGQSCPPPAPAVFSEQVLSPAKVFRRELYTWTTDEQIAEVREGQVLLTRTEREGMGPGYAFEKIASMAEGTGEVSELAAYLAGEAFARARFAWPHPWATRMGWPGESYGDKLVRMLLRQDAWLAIVQGDAIRVVDVDDNEVALSAALAAPERIAVIFFVRDATAGGPYCSGSFNGGGDGYREYIVGNEAMIEEWSIATPEILEKLESDIAMLREFLERIRACPPFVDTVDWNVSVCCQWGRDPGANDLIAYEESLAMPSPYYLPEEAQIEALIATLEAARFEPDPFVVRPGG